MAKEEFKTFVRRHPELIKYVNNDKMTWQKFYDMYILYGEEDEEAWSLYFGKKENNTSVDKPRLKEVFDYIKNVDMDSLQKGISGIEKAISFIQDLGIIKQDQTTRPYEARPMYKSFED